MLAGQMETLVVKTEIPTVARKADNWAALMADSLAVMWVVRMVGGWGVYWVE